MEILGRLFNAGSSKKHPVRIRLEHDTILIISNDNSQSYDTSSVSFSERLGSTPRFLYLPDGGVCEIADNDSIDTYLKTITPKKTISLVHKLESNFRYIFTALLGTVFFIWLFISHIIPYGAKTITDHLSPEMDRIIAAETLELLDDTFFDFSGLKESRIEELRAHFRTLTSDLDDGHGYWLIFRSAGMPNAFALPDGTIVMTDELVNLAEDDRELIGVMAHEIGHVKNRHGLRSLLQNSFTFLVITLVTGDIASVTSLGAALPVFLIESSYSREFEREADIFAKTMLQDKGIETFPLADLLIRLEKQYGGSGKTSYFSTHPGSSERAKLLEH